MVHALVVIEEVVVAPEDRLDRIESKVDKLVDAMTELVRFEEKIAAHQTGMERFGFRLDDLEQRIETIEKVMPLINLLLKATGRIGLTVLGAITLAVLGLIFVL